MNSPERWFYKGLGWLAAIFLYSKGFLILQYGNILFHSHKDMMLYEFFKFVILNANNQKKTV